MSNQPTVYRNLPVSVTYGFPTASEILKGHTSRHFVLRIVSDHFVHVFGANSSQVKMIRTHSQKMLENHFSGGHYVVLDGNLIDYRPASYKGFIQSDDAMVALSDIIGVTDFSNQNLKPYSIAVKGQYSSTSGVNTKSTILGGVWEDFDLDIDGLGHGGSFTNSLVYRFGAFTDKIVTSFIVERLVCTNGMVANAPFVTKAVPVINDWEDNLHVVSSQLKPKFNDILQQRFSEMANPNIRASVSDIVKMENLLEERMKNSKEEDKGRIKSLIDAVSFDRNLNDSYHPAAKVCSHSGVLDSHLTQYDLLNIATEAVSHSSINKDLDSDSDSDFHFNRFANELIFDDFGKKVTIVRSSSPKISDGSDHNRIFFGNDKED